MIDTGSDPLRMARLTLPRPVEAPARHPFPLLASLSPVVGSLVIWAITSSPFALVFAFLGPVIAIASMADARLQGRKTMRREKARFAGDLRRFDASIDTSHDDERSRLVRESPGSIAVLGGPVTDPERWRGSLSSELPVSLGRGRVSSALRIEGSSDDEGLGDLLTKASQLDDAPVVVDARLGIGICGPPVLATAAARGVLLQLAGSLPPEGTTFEAGAGWSELLEALPHTLSVIAADGDTAYSVVTVSEGGGATVVAVAPTEAALPASCRVVVSIGFGRRARVVRHPRSELVGEISAEFVSRDQAAGIAALLTEAAIGRGATTGVLPRSLALADLAQVVGAASLPATFLADSAGPFAVDLVHSGPHAVIGGMTGSGKSELLVSWLLAMAAQNPPATVCFLLVDFKGGASFAPVVDLPHVVGLVTDLDEKSAHRALQSLSAEIRYRERAIADAGVRSVDEDGVELPRLVIVVDEFAALVAGFHELHELVADIAARGRSLGIHLILCTQRPAGVVRDSVLANVPLRMSLRVNNRADSTAVIGTDAASALPATPPGRAMLALDGEPPRAVQVALATALDARHVIDRWSDLPVPRRPWRDELPGLIAARQLDPVDFSLAFGLLDLPQQQRQETASWHPPTQGSMIIIGAGGSGKSVAIASLAAAAVASGGRTVTIVSRSVETAWDTVATTVDALRRDWGADPAAHR